MVDINCFGWQYKHWLLSGWAKLHLLWNWISRISTKNWLHQSVERSTQTHTLSFRSIPIHPKRFNLNSLFLQFIWFDIWLNWILCAGNGMELCIEHYFHIQLPRISNIPQLKLSENYNEKTYSCMASSSTYFNRVTTKLRTACCVHALIFAHDRQTTLLLERWKSLNWIPFVITSCSWWDLLFTRMTNISMPNASEDQ